MEFTTGSIAGESSNCGCVQIIDGHGTFNVQSCEKFQKDVNLADHKRSYALVSIIGPQSSGKSTLLNSLFGTTFAEMYALEGGRPKCTCGIWLERPDFTKPCIVMDSEGTDGKERQDDSTFEKKIAVFSLLISDVVLINMWYHDVGRQQAANRPLFETVFQAVVRSWIPRKTTLMIVIRDTDDIKTLHKMSAGRKSSSDKCSKFPEEEWKALQKKNLKVIEDGLKKDFQQIWNSFSKPEAHKRTPFSAFYNIEVVFLPHPSDGQFENKLAWLSQKFHDSIVPGVLAGDREHVVDGSLFSCNAHDIWDKIKENKDLNLADHKIMMATVRCEQIAKEKFESFAKSKEWDKLSKAVGTQTISDFGKELSEMIKNCLSSYDKEATYLAKDVKLEKRKQLEEKLVQHVRPTYQDMLQRIKSERLENFKKAFEKALYVGGEKFIVVACKCVDDTITQFEEKCRDARIDQANRDESVEVLRELLRDMSSYIDTVAKQMHGKHGGLDRKNFNKMLMKGSAAQVSMREPALNAATGSQLAAGTIVATVGAGAAVIGPVVQAGFPLSIVVGVGIGIGAIAVVAAVGIAVAGVVADKKYRQMKKGQDYIVADADEENQQMKEVQDYIAALNARLLEGPSSVCGEN